MKKFFLFLLPFVCLAAEYEFLTPQTVVIKGEKNNPSGIVSTQYNGSLIWAKENALKRNFLGRILRKPDITFYQCRVYI